MSECEHEWSTKHTKRFYADGVEWFCIHCHETLPWPDAKRMVNEHAWMRREIERVGRALFTGTKAGYVGTEEDLQAIGQHVEGVCETAVYNEGLMSVEAENEALKRENEWLLLALFNLYQATHGLGTVVQVELADVLFETRKAIGYDRLSALFTEKVT